MKKKRYVKPCLEVIVIGDLCDTNAPYMEVVREKSMLVKPLPSRTTSTNRGMRMTA